MLSGRHVIHTGIYMPFDSGVTNEHLNTSYTLLPRYLSSCCGYDTHAVGKWHLGAATVNATPVGRGFRTHTGYWSGAEDYLLHEVANTYDFFDNLVPQIQYNGTYSTHVFADLAVSIINAQAVKGPGAPPLFLYLAFQNVHWPLEAPQEYVDRFANSTGGNGGRQMVCAMAAFLDDAVGNVTGALAAGGLLDNTIIVFVSDNGGPTHNDESTWSNNFPLRGGKNTLWEGGTRVLGMVAGPGVASGRVMTAPVHATDWLPSLVSMATGGEDFRKWAPAGEPVYLDGDGLDVWRSIASAGVEPTNRSWVLLETHNERKYLTHGDGLIIGDWKLVEWGTEAPAVEDGWWAPDGEDILTTLYTVRCTPKGVPRNRAADATACQWPTSCLFNITADPCEYQDVSSMNPDVVKALKARMATFAATSVPPLVGNGCQPRRVNITGSAGSQVTVFQPCDAPPLPPT
jgi:arylsulfatase A-like enzyme